MEFVINKFLSLKLENDVTIIYVAEEPFQQCKFLLLEIPVRDVTSLDNLMSIDEAAQELNRSLEPPDEFSRVNKIPPETEFWGHSSNLQAWYENDYNTKLLHSNLSFPLLKKLTEAGDLLAKKVFKDEVAKRYNTGIGSVRKFLERGNYLRFLTKEEFYSLIDAGAEYEVIKILENTLFVKRYGLDVRNGRVVELHLSGRKLKELPEIITQLKNLEIFSISSNSLDALLNWIGGFKKLKLFRVNNNKLVDLSSSIGSLSSLEKLVAFNNEIIGLPDSIGNLSSLKVLDLFNNQIEILPMSIGKLSSLEELILYENKLNALPESIGNLKSLETLDLAQNDIKTISKSIGKLNSLKTLILSDNNLDNLPDEVGSLSNLKILGLSNNCVNSLPNSFENLVSLREMYLDGNPLAKIPEYIYELPNLTILSIGNTKIKRSQISNKRFKEKNIDVYY